MLPLPTRCYVASGKATSPTSDLNAFDKSLVMAGIGEFNLVPVSSVLPENVKVVGPQPLEMGAITPCVLAQQRGNEGETISAGVSYAFRTDGHGGYVAEGHGHMTGEALREILQWKMEEIAHDRKVELKEIKYEIQELRVPMDHYGACISAIVFLT